jgi:hypothetical protein
MEVGELRENDSDTMGGLREALLGPPLNAPRPCIDGADALLTRYLNGIPDVMKNTYGEDSEATREAIQDVEMIASAPPSQHGICCKRAALLFATKREPELQEYFKKEDADLGTDLVERILPFIDPPFLKHSCQSPESYVTLAVVFSELFKGERLGNWPRDRGTG